MSTVELVKLQHYLIAAKKVRRFPDPNSVNHRENSFYATKTYTNPPMPLTHARKELTIHEASTTDAWEERMRHEPDGVIRQINGKCSL